MSNSNKKRTASSASSYASSLSNTTSTSGSIEQYWLPPISSLISGLHDEEPLLKKIKKTEKKQPQVAYMPMIPYYFHHDTFGIESCMLQLEGQKKFHHYYYI